MYRYTKLHQFMETPANNLSLKRVASLIGAAVSLLAISTFFMTFAKLSITVGDILIQGRDYAVYQMYPNGTGKVMTIIGTFVLLANALLQYLKPKAWLNFVSALVVLLPIMMIRVTEVHVYEEKIGWWVSIFLGLILLFCWAVEYVYYIRSVKRVWPTAVWGGSLVILAIILFIAFKTYSVPFIIFLFPIGICLLLTALLGLIFSKERHKKTEFEPVEEEVALLEGEGEDGIDESAEVETQGQNNMRYLWPIVLSSAIVGIIVVFMISFSGQEDTQGEEWTDVFAPTQRLEEMRKERAEELLNESYGTEEEYTSAHADPYEMSEEEAEEYRRTEMDAQNDWDDDETKYWDHAETKHWEGAINGKWKIEMTISCLDGRVWGTYSYKSNGGEIDLKGEWGNNDELTLIETVNGKETGRFIGDYGNSRFAGVWKSADGQKEYPFSVVLINK